MIRYYCSGFDYNNAFGNGLGDMFKSELKDTKSITYIPAGEDRVEKAIEKYIPIFTEHFKNVDINFEEINVITPDVSSEEAKDMIKRSSFVFLMGGDPFKQLKMCEQLDIISDIKGYDGILLGMSAGAMMMSKYIIITPCSEEYPDFQIGEGLNFDNISIYPHNNTESEEYPEELFANDELYQKQDLLKVVKEYGKFYLLQDHEREDKLFDVSYIKSMNGDIELHTENNGRIWEADNDIVLIQMGNKKVRK